MFDKNFIGKNGFIWWIGVVENNEDPLGLGRCKVRIFGWHGDGSPESKASLPTEDLPWAQAIYPVNAPRNFYDCPRYGDWVMGFFLDGESGQAPCMLGVFNSFNNVTTGIDNTTKFV